MKLLDRNFWVRTASAAVFVVIFMGATLLSVWSFLALLAIILCGSIIELNRLARRGGYRPVLWYPLAVGLLLLAAAGLSTILGIWKYLNILAVALPAAVLLLPLALVAELFRSKPATGTPAPAAPNGTPMVNVGINMLSLTYIALPLVLLVPFTTDGFGYNPRPFLYYMFMVWANDVGAYIFGVTLGRHKMAKRLSPKKSWEGFFGGLLFAMIVGALVGGTKLGGGLGEYVGAGIGWWIGAGAVVAVTSVLGDLVESMFKRSVDVKDSGKMMPGHGGFLDRFDSVFISAPFVVAYFFLAL